MDLQQDTKALRNQQSRTVRAKAPIAANFEDCLQGFDRLCSAINVNTPLSEEHITAEDCQSRLKSWGHDSGAATRSLDHALRRSSQLRTATLELLVDLHSILQDANEDIISPSRESIEQPLDIDGSTSSTTEEIGILDGQVLEISVQQYLEDAVDIVACLSNLLPSLGHPVPDAVFDKNPSPDEAILDIQLATTLFPKAPLSLSERLGKANWRRRQNIRQEGQRALRLDTAKVESDNESPNEDTQSEVPFSPAPRSSLKRQTKNSNQISHYRRRTTSRGTSDTGISTAASTIETVFSRKTFLDGHSVTSIAESEEPQQMSFLTPPEPPIPLTRGSCFICPYCRLEIVVGSQLTTREDWVDHVWLDLEPYLCTFDACIRADKTFGIREDWFQHELECHRIQRVWFCRNFSCRREFDTRELFEKHLQSTHKDLFTSSQLALMIDNCERYSQQPLPKQTCPLCGTVCPDAQILKHHVGMHLEQLALAALLNGEGSEGEEASEGEDDQALEKSHSEFLLDEFVEEQFGFYWPPKEQPVSSAMPKPKQAPIEENMDSRASMKSATSDSSEFLADPKAEEAKKMKEGLWTDKVEAFLSKQTGADQVTESTPSTPTIRSNTPPRIDNFVGRENDLDVIQQSLALPGHICVLSGCGGVGKTATAVEYSYRHEQNYSYVFWIEAETSGGCAEAYNLIATLFDLGGDIIQDQDGLTILVREFLQRTEKRWLLIFDNVEEWSEISQYIPRGLSKTRGTVLITTRKGDLMRPTTSKNYHPIGIDALTLEESRRLLLCSMQPSLKQHDLRSHPEYDLAGEASKLVERLPLAIGMIAGYVQVSRCSLSEFLEIWDERQSRSKKTNQRIESGSVDSSIDALWDIGIRELSTAARNLLDILIFLDPETIQKQLLVGDHEEPFLEFLNSSETIRYKRMIAELSGRRLVAVREKNGKQILSIHRLLQQKILLDLDPTKFTEVFGKVYCLVRKRYPPASPIQVPESQKWPDCKAYTPHVLSLHRAFKASSLIEPSVNLAQLFYDAGFHVWERQTTAYDGITFLETSEEILNTLDFDKNAKLRADIHSILGLFYDNIGTSRRAEGLQRRKETITIRRKIYEKNPRDSESDILLANAANDFGYSLLENNSFEEAGKIFETCYGRYCKWGTEDQIPFEYAKYYLNTGKVRMWQGNFPEAIRFIRRAVVLTEKSGGKTWRYWMFQFILACVLLQSGDLQAALDLHLEVFSARKEVCGMHDSTTVLSNYAVGAMHHHLGNLPEATYYMKECLERAANSRCPEEALGRVRFHLSKIYGEQGLEEEEAKRLDQEARKILEKYSSTTPECLRGVEDKMMVFDEMQPVESGRFTGRNLLPHMQLWSSSKNIRMA